MRPAVSIPRELFDVVERLARRAGKSRSRVYREALEEYVARHAPEEVTEAMNRVCDEGREAPDPFVRVAAHWILKRSAW